MSISTKCHEIYSSAIKYLIFKLHANIYFTKNMFLNNYIELILDQFHARYNKNSLHVDTNNFIIFLIVKYLYFTLYIYIYYSKSTNIGKYYVS